MSDHKIKLTTAKSRYNAMLKKGQEVQKGTLDDRDPNAGMPPREFKKIIIPPKPKSIELSPEAMIIPPLDGLLNDSLVIIGNELARYRSKTAAGKSLELKEARAVQGYMETLVKLSREAREQARHEDLSNLSDEELLSLASKYLQGIESTEVPDSES